MPDSVGGNSNIIAPMAICDACALVYTIVGLHSLSQNFETVNIYVLMAVCIKD